MKKVFALLVMGGLVSLVACGPSEEEQAKMEAEAAAQVEEMMKGLEEEIDVATAEMEETMEGDSAAMEMEEGHEHKDGEEAHKEEAH